MIQSRNKLTPSTICNSQDKYKEKLLAGLLEEKVATCLRLLRTTSLRTRKEVNLKRKSAELDKQKA
jgi:hypothetical protein